MWSSPGTVSGTIPPPCSFFSLTLLDDRQAVLFGGDRPDDWKTNDVFVLDLIEMVERAPIRLCARQVFCLYIALEQAGICRGGALSREEVLPFCGVSGVWW